MYKLVRYLKFIVLLNIYNQDAKASHLKLRKNVPLLITIFKLYCLTPQTILFGSRNNIVPGTFCLFFENEMYSFLKSKAFSVRFVCNHSRFVSRLSDF
ncbi:unknown [Bacteroides sp. CAG:462]|nr:unknown [Bacteroides sp. CAG:462]